MGRRLEQRPENYNLANFREWVDRSRRNLRTNALDLVQLHCPPTAVYSRPEVYDALDALVAEGAIKNYGVSVERADEALEALRHDGTASVQIILNAFRLKPLEEVLPAAMAAGVGIIARVPLASGLLSGKYTKDTTFAENDHRNYNRAGDAFDVGETFSGLTLSWDSRRWPSSSNWYRRARGQRRRPSRGSLRRTASRRSFPVPDRWTRPGQTPPPPAPYSARSSTKASTRSTTTTSARQSTPAGERPSRVTCRPNRRSQTQLLCNGRMSRCSDSLKQQRDKPAEGPEAPSGHAVPGVSGEPGLDNLVFFSSWDRELAGWQGDPG
ncbi:protein IolS [Arthrobacter sp. Hiyo4]|nr:protein IolS [Arthrobacter sp. Hiyo4]